MVWGPISGFLPVDGTAACSRVEHLALDDDCTVVFVFLENMRPATSESLPRASTGACIFMGNKLA